MTLRHDVCRFATASFFALGVGTSVFAAPVDLQIAPNTSANALTASLVTGSRMDVMRFSEESTISTGVLILAITDGRGTQEGWNVSLQADDFQPLDGEIVAIAATGFRVTSDAGLIADIGETEGIETVNIGVPLKHGTRILKAEEGSGTGRFTQELDVELDIPAWQPVGSYQSDITVTIASGPGS